MTFHVRQSGTWKEVATPSVKDGNVWKDLKEGWVKQGGVWKQFFTAVAVVLSNTSIADFVFGTTATAGIIVNTSGQLQKRIGAAVTNISGEWLDPLGSTSGYRVRATLNSGTTPTSGPALNTWHALSTTREWRNDRTTTGNYTSTLLIEIDKGDGTVLDSAVITIQADRSDF